jgi:hypothetical protein
VNSANCSVGEFTASLAVVTGIAAVAGAVAAVLPARCKRSSATDSTTPFKSRGSG